MATRPPPPSVQVTNKIIHNQATKIPGVAPHTQFHKGDWHPPPMWGYLGKYIPEIGSPPISLY